MSDVTFSMHPRLGACAGEGEDGEVVAVVVGLATDVMWDSKGSPGFQVTLEPRDTRESKIFYC